MIDGHIHFNKQPYTLEIVNEMVKTALSKGIDEIWLLDHTHKFKEFAFLYSTLRDDLTVAWYQKKSPIPIQEYFDFIKEVKSHEWPIKIKFGLEVCYFPEHEKQLKEVLNSLPTFDFLIGSVHFEFGSGIDIKKEICEKYDIIEFNKEYFKIEEQAIKSRLFTVIGHPDLIKLYSNISNTEIYLPMIEHLASTFEQYNQLTENNSGLVRHGFPYPGLSEQVIKVFKKHHVKFHRSSDAHEAKDIGRCFEELEENI